MTRMHAVAHLVSAIILLMAIPSAAGEILYARYPALSPDGETVAFTYMGDIWTAPSSGGRPHRLTVHEAEDIRPQFSPDGLKILFSSRRYNNYDVFIIPAGGGRPQQLTFHTADDIGTGWFAAGDSVLFTSSRDGYRDIYKVSAAGGSPVVLTGYPFEQEYNGRVSSDGRYLIFNNGSGLSRWWRRDLKASKNTDVFIQDRRPDEFTSRRLTDFDGHDLWPVYNEERREVYFVSARDEWAQIWKIPFAGGDPVAITAFNDDGVQWLNSNPSGTMLVFEQGFSIWILDPASSELRRVPIEIATDERTNTVETKTFTGDIDWYSLSPDEKKIAIVIHGEVYVIPAEDPEEGIRVTATPARERHPVWGADSRIIYYSSDRSGNYDIYCADIVSGEETRLTQPPENEVKPLVSPDGAYLIFYRGLDKIIRIDLDSREESVWVSGVFFDLGVEPTIEYDWSPDSRWLTFTMAGPTYETDIHVVSLDGEPHNISKFARWNFRPRFSPDGKVIYFSSSFEDQYDTYKIDLRHEPFEFFEAAFDSLFMEDVDSTDSDDAEADSIRQEPPTVVIDIDGIEKRRRKAYELPASSTYPVLTPDGARFVFVASLTGKPEIWSVSTEDDPDLKQLTHSGKDKGYLTVTDDSKKVYFLEDGRLQIIDLEKEKTESLTFTVSMDIDAQALGRQKFVETWQMLNTYFYDSAFHGADWEAVRDKYSPVIDHIRTEPEFRNLVREMMGELRASHLNVYSREATPDKNITTGYTGIEFDRRGAFRIAGVVPESPADLAGIKAGGYVIAINGQPLLTDDNPYRLLAGSIDRRLIVSVADEPGKEGENIALKPTSYGEMRTLVYNDWVETRRAMVDSLSGGRLAYIHIPAMNRSRLQKFKEELVSIAEDKDGLIIDVRNNGGGNIAVHLLGILVKTPYFLRNFRDFPVTSENKMRSKALEKPMTLLINGYSASNSEIFAEGFRRLGLGKIIGEPTAGAVIGTSSYGLIDGTRIRRPSWGAFTIDMEDTDLEPRYPDITIENLPDDFINGRDPQLARAVQELLRDLPSSGD